MFILIAHEASGLSTASTPASENQTLQQQLPEKENEGGPREEAMEVDVAEPGIDAGPAATVAGQADIKPLSGAADSMASLLHQDLGTQLIPPPNYIQAASGTIIIEELDTPATRRRKNLLKKKKRLAAAQLQQLSGPGVPGNMDLYATYSSSVPVAGPSRHADGLVNADVDSELSSLSDAGSDVVEHDAQGTGKPASTIAGTNRQSTIVKEGARLEGGTLGTLPPD